MHFNVCLLSLLIFMMVLMTWMLAEMKVYFPLLCAEWRIWTYENATECQQKCKKSSLNVSYVQMFASWRSWKHFRAIGRQFKQMNAYFLVMNSKRCRAGNQLTEDNDKRRHIEARNTGSNRRQSGGQTPRYPVRGDVNPIASRFSSALHRCYDCC